MSHNLAYQVNRNIVDKNMSNPLSSYTQANCQVTLTDDGYRIYRPPNKTVANDGSTMWGGFVMRFYEPPFTKGHRYVLYFETKGQTSNAPSDIYWTNLAGWGGGGLEPSPSNVVIKNISSNFNSQTWTTISYAWTINDDVYKTCTSSYSSFVQGTVYPSYRDFKWGFGYTSTGELGTDLYIRNVRMYDITTAGKIDIKKTGIIEAGSFVETYSPQSASFSSGGEVGTPEQFYEI